MTPNLSMVVGIVVGIVVALPLARATAVAAVMAAVMVMAGSDHRPTQERRTANRTPRRSPAPSC